MPSWPSRVVMASRSTVSKSMSDEFHQQADVAQWSPASVTYRWWDWTEGPLGRRQPRQSSPSRSCTCRGGVAASGQPWRGRPEGRPRTARGSGQRPSPGVQDHGHCGAGVHPSGTGSSAPGAGCCRRDRLDSQGRGSGLRHSSSRPVDRAFHLAAQSTQTLGKTIRCRCVRLLAPSHRQGGVGVKPMAPVARAAEWSRTAVAAMESSVAHAVSWSSL